MGVNTYGQLGDGTVTQRTVPTAIVSGVNFASGACGDYHTVVCVNGKLYCFGRNNAGQIGDGTIISKSVPTQVGTDTTWGMVSAGNMTSYALKDGALWSWGINTVGQMGDGSRTHKSVPTQVGADTDWTWIGGGAVSALGIRGGNIFAWGEGGYYSLGQNSTTDYSSPVQIGAAGTWLRCSHGLNHWLAIKSTGILMFGGTNTYGQLGNGTIVTDASYSYISVPSGKWTQAAAGDQFSLGIYAGKLYAWGRNDWGQLGLGDVNHRSVPTQVGTDTTWTSIFLGPDESPSFGVSGGKLFAWGKNDQYQLGLNDNVNRSSPVQVGTLANWSFAVGSYQHAVAR